MLRDEKDGLMIPIPQYPLYSAAIPLCGGELERREEERRRKREREMRRIRRRRREKRERWF